MIELPLDLGCVGIGRRVGKDLVGLFVSEKVEQDKGRMKFQPKNENSVLGFWVKFGQVWPSVASIWVRVFEVSGKLLKFQERF